MRLISKYTYPVIAAKGTLVFVRNCRLRVLCAVSLPFNVADPLRGFKSSQWVDHFFNELVPYSQHAVQAASKQGFHRLY